VGATETDDVAATGTSPRDARNDAVIHDLEEPLADASFDAEIELPGGKPTAGRLRRQAGEVRGAFGDTTAPPTHSAIIDGDRSSRRANNAIATRTQSSIPFAYEYVAMRQHNAASTVRDNNRN